MFSDRTATSCRSTVLVSNPAYGVHLNGYVTGIRWFIENRLFVIGFLATQYDSDVEGDVKSDFKNNFVNYWFTSLDEVLQGAALTSFEHRSLREM